MYIIRALGLLTLIVVGTICYKDPTNLTSFLLISLSIILKVYKDISQESFTDLYDWGVLRLEGKGNPDMITNKMIPDLSNLEE